MTNESCERLASRLQHLREDCSSAEMPCECQTEQSAEAGWTMLKTGVEFGDLTVSANTAHLQLCCVRIFRHRCLPASRERIASKCHARLGVQNFVLPDT